MAKPNAVWGIDIGQCALKALRCRPSDESTLITAEAFDYIEYPQILSQPEADPAELIREALELFLSRNNVRGDKVAVSVSGQSGLARFIKLPPVESKKIPDIVKYEARQQIPFALEDVVWDYQQMAGGSEEDGFALETEVGLFAMKRDQVYRALKPFENAGIEVDIIQLTPLAIYNYTVFDQLPDLPPPEEYDPDNPPESLVVLSLGTDTTDLVITNGYRVWQRSVPLGGSHFTKAISKELRLTFAKAEHLKRNAMQAEDRAAVFQAMRPVFSDLLTEVQRSVGFFTNIDRGDKIGRVLALGNAMKLPGLQKYLSQNLGFAVADVQAYRGLSGSAVVASPAFKENLLSFAVCYGLVLQGLGKATLSTNLLPPEIVTDRLIRAKKPWAVGLVATLLLACAISFLGYWRAWNSAYLDDFKEAISRADRVESSASQFANEYKTKVENFGNFDKMGQSIVGNVEGRLLWAEILKAIDYSLPHERDEKQRENIDLSNREEIHITEIDCEHRDDVASWIQEIQPLFEKQHGRNATATPADASATSSSSKSPPGIPMPAPTGLNPGGMSSGSETTATGNEGWIIQLKGYHYHNAAGGMQGSKYVQEKFIKNLEVGKVPLPNGSQKGRKEISIKDLGISYPVLIQDPQINHKYEVLTQELDENGDQVKKTYGRYDFVLQFCWQETPPSKRLKKEQEAAKQAAEAASGAGGEPVTR